MDNATDTTSPRKRRRIASNRSLDSAEKAIADGRRTIGEISAMVEMENGMAGALEDPFPEFDLPVAHPPIATLGSECREMFGMPLGPFMLCIASLGSVGGVALGIALDGSPLQQSICTLVISLI